MLDFEVLPFEAEHAKVFLELAGQAYVDLPSHAQTQDTVPYVEHIYGASNPAGHSMVALARSGDQIVGSLAALPYRFGLDDGSLAVGYQIGAFVVSHQFQRRGIGKRLLEELTSELTTKDDRFIFTFPNDRSIPLFFRLGYVHVRFVPTYAILPSLRSSIRRDRERVRDPQTGAWKFTTITLDEFKASSSSGGSPDDSLGLIRDAEYFRWRFCGPDSAQPYRFVLARSEEGNSEFVVILKTHSFNGIRFIVLVDISAPSVFSIYPAAVRIARAVGRTMGIWFVYVNSNILQLRSKLGKAPLSVSVPTKLNPRPIELLMYPHGNEAVGRTLDGSVVLTADWLSF